MNPILAMIPRSVKAKFVVSLLSYFSKRTDNTIDDAIVGAVAVALTGADHGMVSKAVVETTKVEAKPVPAKNTSANNARKQVSARKKTSARTKKA